MSVKAIVNSKMLIWARETANISLEEASKSSNVSIEKLKSWEDGLDYPTMNQAKKLAKKYQRAFSLFYLEDIPEDFTPIKDFRSSGSDFSSSLIFIIREVETKVAWLRDLLISENENPNPFVGCCNIQNGVDFVANSISEGLKINDRFGAEKDPYRFVIDKCEEKGINVLRAGSFNSHSPIDPNEVRGFTIADSYAPFVFINSRDSDEANLFTLIHELAHIWINETGVSNLIDIDFRSPIPEFGVNQIEIFCNKVAAQVLMPVELMREVFSTLTIGSREFEIARRKFGVSKIAIAYRLLNLNLLNQSEFSYWKNQYDEALSNIEVSPKSSGGNYYRSMMVRNGKTFSSVVLGMYNVGSLSGSITSSLLNIKLNNLQKYQSLLI
jgi:Zn-dependent peptidase ImmA (M78 family)